MNKMYRLAIIGLDVSHAVILPGLMQAPAVKYKVPELHAETCFPFATPFMGKEGIRKRAEYLKGIGVRIVSSFDEAVKDCDAIFLLINDSTLHLEYFKKAAALGKPIFLDKPFADTLENAKKILEIAEENHTRFFTASSLRFAGELEKAMREIDPAQ